MEQNKVEPTHPREDHNITFAEGNKSLRGCYLHGVIDTICESDLPTLVRGHFDWNPGEHPCLVLAPDGTPHQCTQFVWQRGDTDDYASYIVLNTDTTQIEATRKKAANNEWMV